MPHSGLAIHLAPQFVDVRDRGLAYGDGVFETMRCIGGACPDLARHLIRLRAGASALGIVLSDIDVAQLKTSVSALSRQARSDCVLKVIVTRGIGGRGYRSDASAVPQAYLSLHPAPILSDADRLQGVHCELSPRRVHHAGETHGFKTLNRLDQVMASSALNGRIYEALMLDGQGRIVEGTRTNVFFRINGQWSTPPNGDVAVRGILRARLVEEAESVFGRSVDFARLVPSNLALCEGLFLCNSVLGIVPVRSVGCVSLGLDWGIGELIHQVGQLTTP